MTITAAFEEVSLDTLCGDLFLTVGSTNRQTDYFQIFETFMSTNSFSTLCFLCVTSQEQCVMFVVVLMGDGSLLVSQPASLPCWISGVDCFVVRGGLI